MEPRSCWSAASHLLGALRAWPTDVQMKNLHRCAIWARIRTETRAYLPLPGSCAGRPPAPTEEAFRESHRAAAGTMAHSALAIFVCFMSVLLSYYEDMNRCR
jgi:hypothetical protein